MTSGVILVNLVDVSITIKISPFVVPQPLPRLQVTSSLIQQDTAINFITQAPAEIQPALSNMSATCHNVGSDIQCLNVLNKTHQTTLTTHKTAQVKNQLQTITTPVRHNKLEYYLHGYDDTLKSYLVSGFKFGFHINSFNRTNMVSCKANLKSASSLPKIIDDKIGKEVDLGRISGPFDSSPFSQYIVSPLGLREKKAPGEYRVIHDLSFPYDDTSVNSSIPREFATIKYASISDAARHLVQFGRYAFMAKSDIKSAFRIIPINPNDRHLLGFKWNNKFYFDNCLPMGCSSSCQIFESFSTALHWIISQALPHVGIVHVLDDFLFITDSYDTCLSALNCFTDLCKDIGVPLAPEKTVGPDQILPFLGIQLDSVEMAASLPEDKVIKFLSLIETFLTSKSVTLSQMQSLCGMLNFACGIIAPGRAFSRRLYDLTIGVTKSYFRIKITKSVKDDLLVWKQFLLSRNSKTLFLDYIWQSNDVLELFTDAASTIGYGGYFGNEWFAGLWSDNCLRMNIAILELYPICLALHLWSYKLTNKCLLIHTDNMSVVSIINTSTSKEPSIMKLVRRLVLLCMRSNILIKAEHILGSLNLTSDLLSRDQVSKAKQIRPTLEVDPVVVPEKWMLDRWLDK